MCDYPVDIDTCGRRHGSRWPSFDRAACAFKRSCTNHSHNEPLASAAGSGQRRARGVVSMYTYRTMTVWPRRRSARARRSAIETAADETAAAEEVPAEDEAPAEEAAAEDAPAEEETKDES